MHLTIPAREGQAPRAISDHDVARMKLPSGRTHYVRIAYLRDLFGELPTLCKRKMRRADVTISPVDCRDCIIEKSVYTEDRTQTLIAQRIAHEQWMRRAEAAIERDLDAQEAGAA